MNIDPWIDQFKKNILPRIKKEYKPQLVLLFGSRVKGNANENSDIDVIIVSDYFQNIRFINRMALCLKKFDFPKHVDYLCYTKEEFKRLKDKSSVTMDALEYAEKL